MDTPIFAEVARSAAPIRPAPPRAAHEAGHTTGTSVTDLLRRHRAHARTGDGSGAATVYVGHVPDLMTFRPPA